MAFVIYAFLIYLLTVVLPPCIGAEPHQYHITAIYNEKDRQIEGTAKISFTNTGQTDLSEIFLFLYPNIYLEKNPQWNREMFRRVYPTEFHPGSMQILSITNKEGEEISSADFFGNRILKEIQLSKPIPPMAAFEISTRFITRIPERMGVFGRFRDWVTLQGGWHPYLPPLINGKWDLHAPPNASQFHIDLTYPALFHLVASTPMQINNQATDKITASGDADALPFFSLSLGRESLSASAKVDQLTLVYTGPIQSRQYGKQVLDAAVKAASFFSLNWGPLPIMEMPLTHAYLFQDLVTAGANLLYVDAKLFKVLSPLKRFHEVRIARGIFFLLLQEALPLESPWVLELIAETLSNQFSTEVYPNKFDLKGWLRPIRFFPFVDQLIYSDKVSFRQVYFDESIRDTETLFSFHQRAQRGVMGSTQIKRRLGRKKIDLAVTAFKQEHAVNQGVQFTDILLRLYPEIAPLVETRNLAFSPVDFGIKRIERKKLENEYHTTIDIIKKGCDPCEGCDPCQGAGKEPVEIVLYEKSGQTTSSTWDGEGKQHRTVVATPTPPSIVLLDPEWKTSDPRRGNNRDPRLWKMLLNRFYLDYGLTTDFVGYGAGLLFRPVYDATEQIGIDYFHLDSMDMHRLQYSKTVRNGDLLDTSIAYRSPRSAIGSPSEESAGTASVSYLLRHPNIPFLPSSIEWLTGQQPHLTVTFNYDKRFTGGIYDDLKTVRLDIRRSFLFSNYHEIGARFFTGFSSGDLFKENRFFLGGNSGIRGYTPLRFEGDHISLFSLEYRFPLLYETDINLLGLALTHTLQGAVFADFGGVANQVKLLQPSEFMSDIGAGVRWFADSFGIMPVIFRFDVAWPVDSPVAEENEPHFYLSAGQPF